MEAGIIRPVTIEDEMRNSYLDYAMSVIVARALPDLRDGLKPSQRRVLVAMNDLNLAPNRGHLKSAKIAGDTSGNYHPHGESIVYPTLVRMAQPFNMRYPLIDGQGNFGSIDGDPPAAMRYTEARLTAIAMEMLADLERETVDYQPNYDGRLQEPVVLPGRFPNLICNGSAGIAVGMATSIPPHNLSEVCDAVVLLIDNPEATLEDLMHLIPGPDFPTGGVLVGQADIRSGYATGHGRVVIRAKAAIEETRAGRWQIVVTELPYQVNKATLQERIAELVRDHKIEGISDMRDESDRQGTRLVVEVKRDAKPQSVLAQLYKHTALQSTFPMNMLALIEGEPRVLTLKQMLEQYLLHRREVVTRRTTFDLKKAQARAHILEGLKIALDHLDAVIRTIRQSESAERASQALITRFGLDEIQAKAILDMQLRRLAALERNEVLDELAELHNTIAYLQDLLANPPKIIGLVREEMLELKRKFGDPRRSHISDQESSEITLEDMIANVETVVTVSVRGYVKRVPPNTYRPQRRGGVGIRGMMLREEDALRHIVVTNTHDNILFFTDRGRVFQLRAYQIPEAERTARGTPVINLLNIEPQENVTAVVAMAESRGADFFVMATLHGEIKKVKLADFESVRSSGLIAMDLEPGDELGWVRPAPRGSDVIVVSEKGQSVRCKESAVPSRSRAAGGVRSMRLTEDDEVCSMDIVKPGGSLLIVSSGGFAKRTPLVQFPVHGRGGSGVIAMKLTDKSGPVVAAKVVEGQEEVMVISARGIILRTLVSGVSEQGRSAQGVAFMSPGRGDRVACIALLTEGADDAPPTNGRGQRAAAQLALPAGDEAPSRRGRGRPAEGDEFDDDGEMEDGEAEDEEADEDRS